MINIILAIIIRFIENHIMNFIIIINSNIHLFISASIIMIILSMGAKQCIILRLLFTIFMDIEIE